MTTCVHVGDNVAAGARCTSSSRRTRPSAYYYNSKLQQLFVYLARPERVLLRPWFPRCESPCGGHRFVYYDTATTTAAAACSHTQQV